MINSISFENFRGFSQLKMDGVQPITLISGMNNVGKSSVLDGLFLFFDHTASESFMKLNSFRGFPPLSEPKYLWEPIFYNLDTQKTVMIEIGLPEGVAQLQYERDNDYVIPQGGDVPQSVLNQFMTSTQSSYTLKFQYIYNNYKECGHFMANTSGLLRKIDTSLDGNRIHSLEFIQYINSIIIQNNGDVAAMLGTLELAGKKEELVKILKLIEPSITDLTMIMTSGGAQLYAKVNGRLLPIKLSGDGLNKLMFIILVIMAHPGAVILIDEIETGIHYSAYADFWKAIAITALQNNCQVIATTHSYECIVGAVDGIKQADASDRFCYFRIDRQDDMTVAYRYSDELLRTAIDASLEVR